MRLSEELRQRTKRFASNAIPFCVKLPRQSAEADAIGFSFSVFQRFSFCLL
jgi:hypothetical protein